MDAPPPARDKTGSRCYVFRRMKVRSTLFLAALGFVLGQPAPHLRAQTSTGTLSTLYRLTGGPNGSDPGSLIQGSDGNFYGTMLTGGGANLTGTGTVFQLTPGGTYTTLHVFGRSNGASEGIQPGNLLQGRDGNFYGTAAAGGANGEGTVFQVTPSGTLTTLYTFTKLVTGGVNDDGAVPGSLIQGSDGNFYGTTTAGGVNGAGTVFRLTSGGTFGVLSTFGTPVSFPLGVALALPGSRIIQGSDGNFYGTSAFGGDNGVGMVFQLTPGGTFSVLYSFSAPDGTTRLNAEGFSPTGRLVEVGDGTFYGTTFEGGPIGDGTVFSITADGTLTVLNTFDEYQQTGIPGSDGASALTLGRDGNLYGTIPQGGKAFDGTVFQVTPAGTLTILDSLDAATSGRLPTGGLVQGGDGKFYGLTNSGGGTDGTGPGVVFDVAVTTTGAPTAPTAPTASLSVTVAKARLGSGVAGEVTVTPVGGPGQQSRRALQGERQRGQRHGLRGVKRHGQDQAGQDQQNVRDRAPGRPGRRGAEGGQALVARRDGLHGRQQRARQGQAAGPRAVNFPRWMRRRPPLRSQGCTRVSGVISAGAARRFRGWRISPTPCSLSR